MIKNIDSNEMFIMKRKIAKRKHSKRQQQTVQWKISSNLYEYCFKNYIERYGIFLVQSTARQFNNTLFH